MMFMRARRAACMAAALAIAVAAPLHAQGRTIRLRNFDALLTVHSDGKLDVVETITVGFSGQWNGILRDLSLHHNTAQGRATRLDVDIIGVTDAAGVPLRVEQEGKENGYTKSLRIWIPGALDADRTIVIRYRVNNAIRFFFKDSEAGELDELYWNVTGNSWDMPIDSVHARVVLPADIVPTRTAAYTGESGSQSSDALITRAGNEVNFTTRRGLQPYEGITIGVGWPAGHISSRPSEAQVKAFAILRYWPFLVPLMVFWLTFRTWRRRGRDPEELSFVVRYEPIDKMSPAEAGTLVDNVADMKDITSTLVDLAVRGYIKIEEIKEEHLFGLTSSTDYVFHILKRRADWNGVTEHERRYLEGLASAAPSDAYTVKLSELKNRFYKSIGGIKDAIYDSLVAKGYYLKRPDKVKTAWMVGGVFFLMAGFFGVGTAGAMRFELVSVPALIFGVVASGIILMIFGSVMPARTVPGARAREATLGFKEFLERVESERYRKMITSPEMFERYLPYAMAFGVEDKWAKAFENIYREPPNWYVSYGGGPFRVGDFTSNMSSMASTAASSMSSSPSSSGSGGGGSSGGGSGGGGGSGF